MDTNYLTYNDQDGVTVINLIVDPAANGVDPSTQSDVLKFSRLTDSTFVQGYVKAGDARENALDCNRSCRNVTVRGFTLSGGQQAAIVVKGDCTGMVFENVLIEPHPRAWCDILWDDWSDQSQKPSRGVLRNVHREDNKPVRLVFGRFTKPKIEGGNVRVNWWLTIGLHAYNLGKGLLVKVGVVKLPAGCPMVYPI